MSRKLVNIGDGRVIDMDEVVGAKAPAATPPKERPKHPGKPRKKLKKKPKVPAKGNQGKRAVLVPGYAEWFAMRMAQNSKFVNKPGFPKMGRKFGHPDGMTKRQAEKAWAEARRKAKIDMENLEKAGLVPADDEIVKEATLHTLTVMRSPMNQDMGLRAARQILDFYKTKPVTKTETTVNAAEAWLASLAEDPKKHD